jgi:hypothetical protein
VQLDYIEIESRKMSTLTISELIGNHARIQKCQAKRSYELLTINADAY